MQAVQSTAVKSKRITVRWWSALIKSPLARTLTGGFLVIATIEAMFMAVLCIDVHQANHAAANEFELLQGSQKISHVIKTAQKCIDSADNARKLPKEADHYSDYDRKYRNTVNEMDGIIASFRRVGFDTTGTTKLRNSFVQLNNVLHTVLHQEQLTGDPKVAYKAVLDMTDGLYNEFLAEIKAVHKALSDHDSKEDPSIGGLSPQNLLYVAALVDVLMLFGMVLLVERGITKPLSKLTGNCDRIMTGELMPQPERNKNEIDSLEQSFFEMSLVVCENEKRRHSFLEFFQSVQTAALDNVRNCFDSLLQELKLNDRARRNIQKARTNLNTLIQLLHSMTEALEFKAESRILPEYSKTTTSALVADACSAVESLVQKRLIKIEINDANLACSLDPHLIGRVLVNFLSNAIKYSPDRGTVLISVTQEAKLLRFAIKDEGPGISAEGQAKLFKEFSQLDSPDGVKRSGTGLGLVICKQIVEAHGGTVGIHSEVGQGSCFWFQMPESADAKTKPVSAEPLISIGVKKKSDPLNKSKGHRSGLKSTFVIMMVCLLIPQSILFLKLHTMFDDSSKRAANFHNEKEILMGSEEMLGMYLTWKLDVAKSIDNFRIDDLLNTDPKLENILSQCKWMLAKTNKSSKIHLELKKIVSGMKRLRKFTDYVGKNKAAMNVAALPPLVAQARKLAHDAELSMFEIMKLEDSNIQSSYGWSMDIQQNLITALLVAAIINSILLAAVCMIGLRITERIADLKHKAQDFAGGKRLEPTLSGRDELVYLDARLCEVSQAIRDADVQRQKLIAVINHDLRTPLSSIINGLQMILASGYGDIGANEQVLTTAAEQELNHLLQQINDLLLIEKIDAGLYQLSSERFEVGPVLEATAKSFDQSASRRGITLLPAISAECQDLCINGDRTLVEREFAIIISNAVNAAPQGSTIDVSIQRAGQVISVSFKDHGDGINEELLPQIFERFRFVAGKPVTGLGLPLAQRLSAIHGGSLEINCTPDGTETKMLLPIAA